MSQSIFRPVKISDAALFYRLECEVYREDKSATLEEIQEWIQRSPDSFLVLEDDEATISFIHHGLVREDYISEAGFKAQVVDDQEASFVLIRSVVANPKSQSNYHLSWLMEELERRLDAAGIKAIHIRCRDPQVDVFRQMAFTYVEAMVSDDVGTWHQMSLRLSQYYGR